MSCAGRPVKVALTGPPAAGKSTVLSLLSSAGVPVFSADEEVKRLSLPCKAGYHEVCRRFGLRFLDEEGRLNRPLMLREMLEDEALKKALEEIFHPLVRRALEAWFEKHRERRLLAAEIPLLYQVGWEPLFDLVIWVDTPREVVTRRLTHRLKDPLLAERLLMAYEKDLPPERKKAFPLKGTLAPEELKKELSRILSQGGVFLDLL